jgi:hypothetical protein
LGWDVLMSRFKIGSTCLVLGLLLRAAGRRPGLAGRMLALGAHLSFTMPMVFCAYMRLPLGGDLIDPVPARLDAAVGFSWRDAALALADHRRISAALATIYLGSLWQIALLMLWPAAMRRSTASC